ncbi:MAG: alpha/beta fold hydrolase [Rhodocyclaceae bacterium]|nr:alpha/beta fold hydrolase [Rhodocyclaceae bacterium]MBX3666909.1 alpha/beta fold hydrolase [Rhodocyclaceae bacterium]
MVGPLAHAQAAWASHPQELAEQTLLFWTRASHLAAHIGTRLTGGKSADPEKPHPDDERFSDPVWTEDPVWNALKESYLLLTHHVLDMLHSTPGQAEAERRRAAFWWRQALNALAPTNWLATNPVAQRLAFESGGKSLRAGMENMLADLRRGEVRMADPSDFQVGVNLAVTPGSVVYRNRLLEVVHYRPQTDKVHPVPIVIVTPWINKFYVLDLTPKKSMVRHLVAAGYSVFITSWKNPDASMRDVTFDAYLTDGIDRIVNVAREICGAEKVHAVGYCIGGTALAMYMAWANRHYAADAVPVGHWSVFTTLVDFHRPGDIEVFVDRYSVRYLQQQMGVQGYLDGRSMAASFRLLRSNGLIWHYIVRGWLYGEAPPAFDVLYWNMDTTRMPAAMHSWYLEQLYLENRLVEKDALQLAGEPLDLGRIVQPLYAVAAEDDHIVPWREGFRVCKYVGGERRFVLTSSGHILGIINPPVDPPKRRYRAGAVHAGESVTVWSDQATNQAGSWWTDWLAWLGERTGAQSAAPPRASNKYPGLCAAPGTYVLER